MASSPDGLNNKKLPFLALTPPDIGARFTQANRAMPTLAKPSAERQGARMTPKFGALSETFRHAQVALSGDAVTEVDPELVVVFDLAGSVKDFHNAINGVAGLEFLSELIDDETEPDDDFYMVSGVDGRTDDLVQHSLYMVMSNATAVAQLVSLFETWKNDPSVEFQHGQGKFKMAFGQMRNIRRWGPQDRIRETGLADDWAEQLDLVGQSQSTVLVEIELWYRRDAGARTEAERRVREIILTSGGVIKDYAQIAEISYHALLVELPIQQVQAVMERGADAIDLLTANEIMFVSPYSPMAVEQTEVEPVVAENLPEAAAVSGLPRIALLDGLPFQNHDLLKDRLVIDDPDGLGDDYSVIARLHGTAMASLIIYGDLSAPGASLERPIYVRPIMQPSDFSSRREEVLNDRLFTDLLRRSIVRIVSGENGRPATAPSVRVINLSIGAESRALIRRMSPLGRLLDWLAVEYNLLFIVSAGNHLRRPISIPSKSAGDLNLAKVDVLKFAHQAMRVRGILPPGDALNALTVGAIHKDSAGTLDVPDTVWDLIGADMPALYGGTGPGVGRSIKPEIHHAGGRAWYVKPLVTGHDESVEVGIAETGATGPGHRVAAPGRGGATNTTLFTHGTSNATALVTREASYLFDVLEAGADDTADASFPSALYHPVLVKALLVHASSWGNIDTKLRSILQLDPARARRELTAILGYGTLDANRAGAAAANRAVLITGNSIGRGERHTYNIPLPQSLRAKAAWHRFTVTLAYYAPTVGHLNRYRGAKVFFDKPDDKETGGSRVQADHHATRRGSCQHEIFDGSQAMVYGNDGVLPIHVQCMDDAQRLKSGKTIRYGLVVSVETALETSMTIHQEVRQRLQAQVAARSRTRL